MDAKSLRREIDKKRAEAERRRQLAGRKVQDASGHHAIGLDTKAEVEEREIQSLTEQADRLDQEAAQLDATVAAVVAAAVAIEHREKELKKELEHKIDDLEKERRRLLG